MKKLLLFLVILLGNIFTYISFASSGDLQFVIDKVNVIDDKTISILFNKPLAKEPVEFKIYNSSGSELIVINVGFPKFSTINNEAVVTVSNKIEENSKYNILVSSALSIDGDKLQQIDVKNATLLETGTGIVVNQESQSGSNIDLKSIFQENLNNQENTDIQDTQSISNDSTNNKNTILTSEESLKSINNEKIEIQEKNNNQNNLSNFGSLEVKKLPTTGPNIIYLLLFTLILIGPYFIFLRFRKGN